MNVFFLDRDPVVAAKYHCDRHVVKMIVETAQLLSTACHMVGVDDNDLYKKTHVNHPSSVWVRSSRHHYVWTLRLLVALCREYTGRYRKIHKTEDKVAVLSKYQDLFDDVAWSDPPQCMPDEYKNNLATFAYREYYNGEKRSFATWKNEVPFWWRQDA